MANSKAPVVLVGVYDDDDILLDAVKKIRQENVVIEDVFTPFPVHGLEHELGFKESRLPTAAFMFGCLGFLLALTMQTYMYTIDWNMNVGGKPPFPLPSFVPILFEFTVLIASLGMVGSYLVVNKLHPRKKPDIIDPRQTDDLFLVTVVKSQHEADDAKVMDLFKATGAIDTRVHSREVSEEDATADAHSAQPATA